MLSGRFVVPVCLSNLLLPLIFDAHTGTNISPPVATNKLQNEFINRNMHWLRQTDTQSKRENEWQTQSK